MRAFRKKTTLTTPGQRVFLVTTAAVLAALALSSLLGTMIAGSGLLTMPVFLLIALIGGTAPRVQVGDVEASDEGLSLNGAPIALRKDLVSGLIRQEKGEHFVRVSTKGNWWDIGVSSDEEARDLLAALHLDPASTSTDFAMSIVRSKINWLTIAILVALPFTMLGVFTWAPSAALPVLASMIGLFVLREKLITRASVVVGVDGVVVREGISTPKFVLHERIRSVHARGRDVVLKLTDGSKIRVKAPKDDGRRLAAAIADLVRRAREAHDDLASALEAPALARGARDARAWLANLRRIGSGETTFREAPLTRERLLAIVESAVATAEQRLAAATALRANGMPEEEAPRVRVVIDRCAEPELKQRLRVVLEAEDDDELVKALEAT